MPKFSKELIASVNNKAIANDIDPLLLFSALRTIAASVLNNDIKTRLGWVSQQIGLNYAKSLAETQKPSTANDFELLTDEQLSEVAKHDNWESSLS